jgi:hypothetical protein
MMEEFEGLTSAFNVENAITTPEEIESRIQSIEQRKNLLNQGTNDHSVFEDQRYIQEEMRTLIEAARGVMKKYEQNLKIGAHARDFEVYAKLLDSIGNQYKSLLELNKAVFDAEMTSSKLDINNIGDQKITLTSAQLIDMVDKAREQSELNVIDAVFTIENVERKVEEKKEE